MKEKFAQYNLELQEVLIGTPHQRRRPAARSSRSSRSCAAGRSPRSRWRPTAARRRRPSRSASCARPRRAPGSRPLLTESEISITVQSNHGKAEYQRALQQAAQVKTMADAESVKIKMIAEADAERRGRVGVAQAIAVEEQVRAYGGPVYQLTQSVLARFAEAIQQSGVRRAQQRSSSATATATTARAPSPTSSVCS